MSVPHKGHPSSRDMQTLQILQTTDCEGQHNTFLLPFTSGQHRRDCGVEITHLCSIVHLAELKLDGSLAEAAQSLAQL